MHVTHPGPNCGHQSTASLSAGAQLFVFSIREWRIAVRQQSCAQHRLYPFYRRYDVLAAVPILNELMQQLAVTAYRPVKIHCPCRSDVTDDESKLLSSFQRLQKGDKTLAEEAVSDLVGSSFATTFLRIGQAYVDELLASKLSLLGASNLSLVPKPSASPKDLH